MRLLLGPGPSNVASSVLEASARPLVGHLDPSFLGVLDETADRLRSVFRTSNRMTFAVSATGSAGMEAALVNVLEPGDVAVVCVNGVFGGRMADIASRAGAEVVRVEAPWGEPIRPSQVREALDANPGAKALAVVHAETSTGVASPVEEIAALLRGRPCLLLVDAVTSLAGMPVEVDGWGVDVCYSGTQKCLSVPPGLAPITFSERALEVVRGRGTPVRSWYLDVTLLERYWGDERVYHHTAPVSAIRGLHEGLRLVLDEGLEERWRRHAEAGAALAKELEARGFAYVAAEDHRLPMLHCVRVPDGIEEGPARRRLLEEHGIEVGGGLGVFAGSCWRIGLMGENARRSSLDRLLQALDEVLRS